VAFGRCAVGERVLRVAAVLASSPKTRLSSSLPAPKCEPMSTTERVAAFAACFFNRCRGVRSTNDDDVPVRPAASAYCQRLPRPRRLPAAIGTAVPFISCIGPGVVARFTTRTWEGAARASA
jgi:hypothetical protein